MSDAILTEPLTWHRPADRLPRQGVPVLVVHRLPSGEPSDPVRGWYSVERGWFADLARVGEVVAWASWPRGPSAAVSVVRPAMGLAEFVRKQASDYARGRMTEARAAALDTIADEALAGIGLRSAERMRRVALAGAWWWEYGDPND